jgi:hypothetical protein
MIEFKLKTYRKKIEVISDDLRAKFKAPFIFYLTNKDDKMFFFITFVIVDLMKNEMKYIYSYFPENVEKLKDYEDLNLLKTSSFSNPHHSLQINPDEDFFTFREDRTYFMYINYKKNIMRIYLGKDLPCPERDRLRLIGATFFKDDEDSRFFYITATENNQENMECYLNFYKASLDLSIFEKVFQAPYDSRLEPPHVTRKFKDYLFNSKFYNTQFRHNKTGRLFKDKKELDYYVYNNLFKEFCAEINKNFLETKFEEEYEAIRCKEKFPTEFRKFCEKRGMNTMEICKNVKKYSSSALPGTIIVVDLHNKTLNEYETTFCAPAHFEIDFIEKAIYTSSHNFTREGNLYFLGPAAIDKFIMKNGRAVKKRTFTNPFGYRFTSHRVFYYKNKPFICTIGHPNRLFLIDAKKMKLHYAVNFFEDVLSDKADVADFLNHRCNSKSFIAFEVSCDGEIILLLGSSSILFYSFTEKKIIVQLPFLPKENLEKNVSLNNFFVIGAHINYLV